MRTNGIPMPTEYANNRLNAIPGVVAARVIIVPKIGPTHGVHPAADAIPNKNEIDPNGVRKLSPRGRRGEGGPRGARPRPLLKVRPA